ncbi:MAG: ferritin [Phycisphaerae bacterium]|jgi:ferritin
MTMSDAMKAKLNEQITNEFFAAQLYLAMACQFDSMSLKMLSARFRKQVDEERQHAMKILDYVLETGGKVTLQALPAPTTEWPSVVAAVEAALGHEKKVTGQINALVAQAEQDKDYATRNFLNWYVEEQVEEEASMSYLLDVARMAGQNMLLVESAVSRMG